MRAVCAHHEVQRLARRHPANRHLEVEAARQVIRIGAVVVVFQPDDAVGLTNVVGHEPDLRAGLPVRGAAAVHVVGGQERRIPTGLRHDEPQHDVMVTGRNIAGMDVELVRVDRLAGSRGTIGYAVPCRHTGRVDVDERRTGPGRVAADALVDAAGDGFPECRRVGGIKIVCAQILPLAAVLVGVRLAVGADRRAGGDVLAQGLAAVVHGVRAHRGRESRRHQANKCLFLHKTLLFCHAPHGIHRFVHLIISKK